MVGQSDRHQIMFINNQNFPTIQILHFGTPPILRTNAYLYESLWKHLMIFLQLFTGWYRQLVIHLYILQLSYQMGQCHKTAAVTIWQTDKQEYFLSLSQIISIHHAVMAHINLWLIPSCWACKIYCSIPHMLEIR